MSTLSSRAFAYAAFPYRDLARCEISAAGRPRVRGWVPRQPEIVVDRVVLRAAIVPKSDRAGLPAAAARKGYRGPEGAKGTRFDGRPICREFFEDPFPVYEELRGGRPRGMAVGLRRLPVARHAEGFSTIGKPFVRAAAPTSPPLPKMKRWRTKGLVLVTVRPKYSLPY